jgi:hypothetical protein
MLPHMKESESMLFLSFLRNSNKYLEFGCGGSTVLAASYVRHSVVSVDSSKEWIDKINKECEKCQIEPHFVYVDIGPVGDWGTPQTPTGNWPNYHTKVWKHFDACDADLFLIDGRFRVACFAQILMYCSNPIIAVHDFTSRKKHYSAIWEIGREIASVDDLSFFMPASNNLSKAKRILDIYKFDYK